MRPTTNSSSTPLTTSGLPITTGELPTVTGELPAVIDTSAKGLTLPKTDIGGKVKSHDKAHLQAERGFMNQHKKSQPQPRWNLPRR